MLKFSFLFITNKRHHLISILETCLNMVQLKQILAQVVFLGLWNDGFVVARLVSFCATSSSGDLHFARFIFDRSHNPTAFSYNSLIRGYASSTNPIQSIHLFHAMLQNGIYADKYTFPFVLKACTRADCFPQARKFHSLLLKCGFQSDLHIQTSLLHTYAAFDCIGASKKVFDEMPQRSTVTWNAIISCFSMSNRDVESLVLFGEMLRERVDVNDETFTSVLCSCAKLGTLAWGQCVHGFVIRKRASSSPGTELGTSLVHMYAKCGKLDYGIRVFDQMDARDVSAWTAMIGGLAIYGFGKEAISLFDNMVQEGIKPDSVSFTSVLHACSHSGMVKEGLRIFKTMKDVYAVDARIEHFGAMVDLLGRAGLLEEAERLANSMPIERNAIIWGALLNACVINNEFAMGSQTSNGVLELGLDRLNATFYVLLSNLYATCGKWEEVRNVRDMMIERRVKKTKGHSLIEVDGRVHMFLVRDNTSPFKEDL